MERFGGAGRASGRGEGRGQETGRGRDPRMALSEASSSEGTGSYLETTGRGSQIKRKTDSKYKSCFSFSHNL